MKFFELEPRKIEGGGFTILCPGCGVVRIVIQKPWAWKIEDDGSITVRPSLDANNAGHAHFEITKGEITFSPEDKARCRGL